MNIWSKDFWFQKRFGLKNNVGPKVYWTKKKFLLYKALWVDKILVKKT